MHFVLVLAFEADSRAVHFCHPEGVERLAAEHFLDALPGFLGMRFGSNEKSFELRVLLGIQAVFQEDGVQPAQV